MSMKGEIGSEEIMSVCDDSSATWVVVDAIVAEEIMMYQPRSLLNAC